MHSIDHDPLSDIASERDGLMDDPTLSRWCVAMLAAGWAFTALCGFALADALSVDFLGLPLGVFLGGQGALIGAVALIAVGVGRRPGEKGRGQSRSRSAATSGASAGGIG